ncbi:flagellar motor switch protein FliG [Vibrio parahaemolyticus]|uniref:Flagellar motor switch protein FliG n=22 Tax=Vibrio TaxID=662 RepID=A0A0D1RL57_VIBPH|nr:MULTISPECIES: flagellar motor switch protein FliG [Vibrio]EFO35459.1 flagellar motor switch protein FliG [Vibrio parahaemolyticus Peru-466]EFO49699.1 flagellar motor switch protein FliG [Vibrio parahaemolyticus K5030]EJG0763960.1 flagellar motor switch protein FliG [Vibrio parahaemolyticus O5:K30]EJG0873193.1 flagellar motor switch protein FliG [Vibrio parahaemolyticus O3]EJG0901851.1 flagellar motor switch protein FliG [Vibrio parahaemolyticus O3:K56]EJG0921113.1 flagellar motor switch pr
MNTAQLTSKQTLSYVEQTALVLLGMGEDAAAKVLQHFTRDETQRVTRAMAKLNGIKSDSARGVIQNFFEDFREHSGIRGASKEYLSNTLRKALGNDLAKGLLNNLYGDEIRNNMQRLQWVEAETLARFIVNEHPQMQAIFLAYLPADSSSAVLKHLPQDYHDEIIFRIAQLQDIDHQVATDLHELVERCIEKVSASQSVPLSGVKQAADIINRFEGDRGSLMEMLKLHDEEVVNAIEENMFDFMVLGRQREETMDMLVQQIPLELWATALKGSDITLQQAIKRSMPQRMVKALEDDMEARGAVALSRVQKARQDIMQMVRELDESGEVQLLLYEEPTVE